MPLLDTTRPSFIGYSSGWRRETNSMSACRSGRSKRLTQRKQATASSCSGSSWPRRAASSARRGARVKPPMQAPTGWTERPPSRREDLVAGLLQAQPALHRGAVLFRQGHHALAAEEVGGGEHVDVQGMALDPFPAVVEPPQGPYRRIDRNLEKALEGVDGAHLIRDRTDSADPGGDVRGLAGVPAAQERLEEARRLEDLEAQVDDLAAVDGEVQRSLALDARQIVDPDGPSLAPFRSHRWLPAGDARSR